MSKTYSKTAAITKTALIAALYVVLTLVFAPIAFSTVRSGSANLNGAAGVYRPGGAGAEHRLLPGKTSWACCLAPTPPA